nr:glycosyltransferase family 4 protein [Synechococcus sp. UW179A]
MNILFVHQNFPGQYRHITREIAKSKTHNIIALSTTPPQEKIPESVQLLRYQITQGNTENIHPWVLETESKVIRGEACAKAAHRIAQQGFVPDLICAHPGWGESLFLKEIWPTTPILHYQEFYYKSKGFDLDFDPEIQGDATKWENAAKGFMKNAAVQLSLEISNWNICPTEFQKSSFPGHWQESISAIHDGIDTQIATPNPSAKTLQIDKQILLNPEDKIITFVNRTLEPYRGYHTFIRSIPHIQQQLPNAKIVIVGETTGVSYGGKCEKGEWKDHFLKEIEGKYDPEFIHFTGTLGYEQYLQLLQLSKVHVYLTYPFVLSWSLMEAMSTGCPIVGSATAPVQELIKHRHNGLLVDFFDHKALADSVTELLNDREQAQAMGQRARRTILKDYSLKACVPRHLSLMSLVASGSLKRN